MQRNRLLIPLLLSLALLAACNSSNSAPTEKGMIVTNVRANMTLPTDTGSFWLDITNNTESEDSLVGAKADGCGTVELHKMSMDNGVMSMGAVEGGKVALPVGKTLKLEPAGLHLMCINKAAPLEAGTSLTLTLQFAKAGEIQTAAKVVEPGEMQMDH